MDNKNNLMQNQYTFPRQTVHSFSGQTIHWSCQQEYWILEACQFSKPQEAGSDPWHEDACLISQHCSAKPYCPSYKCLKYSMMFFYFTSNYWKDYRPGLRLLNQFMRLSEADIGYSQSWPERVLMAKLGISCHTTCVLFYCPLG